MPKSHECTIENSDIAYEIQYNKITKDLTFTASTDGAVQRTNDTISSLEAQTKAVNSLIGNNKICSIDSRLFKDPNMKGRANKTRFGNYCRNHEKSISNCSKHKIDEGFKKMRRELTEEKKKRLQETSNNKPFFNNPDRRNNNYA